MLITNRRPPVTTRYAGLKRILEERQHRIRSEVTGHTLRCPGSWTAGSQLREVLDGVEVAEADAQEEIELAVVQLKTEMLGKIDEALARLRDGDYGCCVECGEDISETRRTALPFAVPFDAGRANSHTKPNRRNAPGGSRTASRTGRASAFNV